MHAARGPARLGTELRRHEIAGLIPCYNEAASSGRVVLNTVTRGRREMKLLAYLGISGPGKNIEKE